MLSCVARLPKTWDRSARRRMMLPAISAAPWTIGMPLCAFAQPSPWLASTRRRNALFLLCWTLSSMNRWMFARLRSPRWRTWLRADLVITGLMRTLKDDRDNSTRGGAAFALGRIAAPGKDIGKRQVELIAALTKAMRDDKSAMVRECCMETLRNFGPDAKEAIPVLLARVPGETRDCYAALDTLARMGPVAVPASVRR